MAPMAIATGLTIGTNAALHPDETESLWDSLFGPNE